MTSEQLSINAEFDHEKVLILKRRRSGLVAAIAFHSTLLGPAVGGMRYRRYPSVSDAVIDALRLSRAMTLKNAAAGLDWGGGKLCVVDDGDQNRRTERLEDLADILNELQGEFIVGKDVGATIPDMDVLAANTRWVVGKSVQMGGLGDPSPATAATVLGAIESALRVTIGDSVLQGKSVAIIGVGGVGGSLARILHQHGAVLQLADIDNERARIMADAVGGQIVDTEEALVAEVDVLAPCAVGEMIGESEVERLRCRIIASGANNPLVDERLADVLHQRDILYVPDYLANAGGVIQNAVEFAGDGLAPFNPAC